MKDRFQTLKSKLSGRVAIAAVLGAVGLAAAGTALAADKGSEKSSAAAARQPNGPAMRDAAPGGRRGRLRDRLRRPRSAIGDLTTTSHRSSPSTSTASAPTRSRRRWSEIADEHEAERRSEMADALAAELDGVDADAIADALGVAEEKMRAAFESGDMPDPGLFAQTLADELGISDGRRHEGARGAHQQASEDPASTASAMARPAPRGCRAASAPARGRRRL